MFITITSKLQVTLPADVLDALGARPGDRLELQPSADGFLLRVDRVSASSMAPLQGKLNKAAAAFDIRTFREQVQDPALRS